MTQLIVFDSLAKKIFRPDTPWLVSEHAWRTGGASAGVATMFAENNSLVAIEDLLKGSIVDTANDATIALAEGHSGSENEFVARMNRKAESLGMNNTVYVDSNGRNQTEGKTNLEDMTKLARGLVAAHEEFLPLYSLQEFTWNKITQRNKNKLLDDTMKIDGFVLNYSEKDGYGGILTARKNDRRIIVALSGMNSADARYYEVLKLVKYGLARYQSIALFGENELVSRARVAGGEERWVDLITGGVVKLDLTKNEQAHAQIFFQYQGPVRAPIEQGTEMGKLIVKIDDRPIKSELLYAAKNIQPRTSMWRNAFDNILIRIFGG